MQHSLELNTARPGFSIGKCSSSGRCLFESVSALHLRSRSLMRALPICERASPRSIEPLVRAEGLLHSSASAREPRTQVRSPHRHHVSNKYQHHGRYSSIHGEEEHHYLVSDLECRCCLHPESKDKCWRDFLRRYAVKFSLAVPSLDWSQRQIPPIPLH